jgi:hypothetical protein
MCSQISAVEPGDGVDVEEQQRVFGLGAQLLEVGVDAVLVDVVDADEPGVLGVGEGELLGPAPRRWSASRAGRAPCRRSRG